MPQRSQHSSFPDNLRRPLECRCITWLKTIRQNLKSSNLSLNKETQNRPLWRLISAFGDTNSQRHMPEKNKMCLTQFCNSKHDSTSRFRPFHVDRRRTLPGVLWGCSLCLPVPRAHVRTPRLQKSQQRLALAYLQLASVAELQKTSAAQKIYSVQLPNSWKIYKNIQQWYSICKPSWLSGV